ncbi:pyruvate:ferredoxin (flavodoxin) oxidoreductase [Dongshaea marina]|uniref:pyruvate:ferredoxin (flavodoxin) oxidoreductase n=1 Tax=Dongshaea marina TaxID=2047966 RepID=UPI000D3E2DB4|nr:pyruvate:ferredoxin (flavodoxin) oxidoreductase [Dongshaea marina]
MITTDANNLVASVAYKTNDVVAIYPITPSSSMAELCDQWACGGKKNLWGDIPRIVEMQSEGGAIAAVHGAIQTGGLATSFTSSQGLLLMIPNLYKIAGELTPFVLHVAARTVATHALSIFCDHSDVMAVRQTGCAMLCSSSVEESQDLALIAHRTTLNSRVPFIHFFDGFQTSHEINKVPVLEDALIEQFIDQDKVQEHRDRALNPDKPVVRGTASNPDTFFQAREATNLFYQNCVRELVVAMEDFGKATGRYYLPFDYYGDPDAERVIVLMGSAAETVEETIDWLAERGEKVGCVRVRLYRPFSAEHLLKVIPASAKKIAVLDRTKEPGAQGEPLYQDVVTAFANALQLGNVASMPTIIGGRYGLSSKEFTPACVCAVYNELAKAEPKRIFTVGITDDISQLSLALPDMQSIQPDNRLRALFYGLGSDGSVSAAKNSIRILGENTDNYVQGKFVYDSKKAGALTVSHLRAGPDPIRSSYLISSADFVGIHQFQFIDKYDVLEHIRSGGTVLINTPYPIDEIWQRLPREFQQTVIERKLKLHAVNAARIARECNLGQRINTVMQSGFFALSGVLPVEQAMELVRQAIASSYGKAGQEVVENNCLAVEKTLEELHAIEYPAQVTSERSRPPVVSELAPDFVKTVTAMMLAGKGDELPVSAFPPDGTWPMGTTQWEKRNIADEIPVWEPDLCTQCNHCVVACPHAAIRAKIVEPEAMQGKPESLAELTVRSRDFKGDSYVLQVAPEDCTGCNLCVEVCPAKDRKNPERKAINMVPQPEVLERERANYDFFLKLPEMPATKLERIDVRTSQLMQPLIEYSGACSGCGETPYIKLLTQLFGDRMLIANATGCSSIYGGNLPTTPYTTNPEGRGPAWSNSLFEDNAEFGLGYRLSVDALRVKAARLLHELSGSLDKALLTEILEASQSDATEIEAQRGRVSELRSQLAKLEGSEAKELHEIADYLVEKSIWLIGGDGWAYDIGFGGVDHVLSTGENVNMMVLDTQGYSNTGGQQSKATPLGAIAKFASQGKRQERKDLGLSMMMYGHIYVAQIAIGAQMNQAVKAIREAEAYPGPSLIIAYSPCEDHGYDLADSYIHMKQIVDSGFWPLYRFDPRRVDEGKPGLQLDSRDPKLSVESFMREELRFKRLLRSEPEVAEQLMAEADRYAQQRVALLKHLASGKE